MLVWLLVWFSGFLVGFADCGGLICYVVVCVVGCGVLGLVVWVRLLACVLVWVCYVCLFC